MSVLSSSLFGFGVGTNLKLRFNSFVSATERSLDEMLIFFGFMEFSPEFFMPSVLMSTVCCSVDSADVDSRVAANSGGAVIKNCLVAMVPIFPVDLNPFAIEMA